MLPSIDGLTARLARARFRFLVINERIDNEQCQKLCGSIGRTATRDLASLVEKGLIDMKGELKGAYYVLSSAVKI